MNIKVTPLISILVPCYNCDTTIERCLNSIVNQTYFNLEIIIVNDGSTDGSLIKLQSFRKRDSRIKVINQKNEGLARTRNILLENALGEYIYFVDSDDWINLEAIDKLITIALLNNTDIIVNSYYKSTIKKEKIFYISNNMKSNDSNKEYLINNVTFAWGTFVKRKYLIDNNFNFNENFNFFEDAGVMTYWIYKAKRFYYFDEPQYHYFVNKKSLSRENQMSYIKIWNSIQQLKNLYNLFSKENFKRFPNEINDSLCFFHCVIFTYIEFQSNITREEKKKLKQNLRNLEIKKLRFPKIYWKYFYFCLYKLFLW